MRVLMLFSLLSFSFLASADGLPEATDKLCTKIKTCGMAELDKQEIPPEMKEMMVGMFNGMCSSMVAPYMMQAKDAGLEAKAVACLETINNMSCEVLMDGGNNETPECKEFEKAAKDAYPDSQ